MAKRIVVWTFTASRQRREILKYWVQKNGSTIYAEKLIVLIRDRLSIISSHPNSFPKASLPHIRVSSLGHYSIFYKLTESELIVVAFWDNRQNPKKLLEIIQQT